MRLGYIVIAAATLLMGAPAAADEPICADRPGLATPTCTVPAGLTQLETGIADWLHDRSGAIRTDELVLGETAVKLGITKHLHFELVVTPYVHSQERENGSTSTMSGFGDLSVAAKYRVTGDDAPVQLALRLFVKVPTAKEPLGNQTIEGGLIVPVEYSISDSKLSLGLSPELDIVADGDGSGHHLAMTQVIAVALPLSSRVSATVELSGMWDLDPVRADHQYAVGGSIAWLLSNDMQIDAGLIAGLNRSTADIELYSGLAFRF